jgi:hypothetical protein
MSRSSLYRLSGWALLPGAILMVAGSFVSGLATSESGTLESGPGAR